jgi:hypothetical protein
MTDRQSLNQTIRDRKYHVVLIPRRPKKAIYGQYANTAGKIFHTPPVAAALHEPVVLLTEPIERPIGGGPSLGLQAHRVLQGRYLIRE